MKKSPREEYELYRELARITGSENCLNYDACPLPGTSLVVNIDGYSEKYSRYSWMDIDAWAYRAVMASLSDIIVVGGRPIAVMASMGVKSREEAIEASHGIGMASQDTGVTVLKSDTNLAHGERWIDVASIGVINRDPIPRKARLHIENKVAVVQIGYSGYGLLETLIVDGKIHYDRIPGWLIYRRPPINVWRLLSTCDIIAGMDNSDGLGYTLATLGFLNALDIYVEQVGVDPRILKALEDIDIDIPVLLRSWEDYNLVYLVDEDNIDCLERNCRKENIPITIMGWAEKGHGRLFHKGQVISDGKGWGWI